MIAAPVAAWAMGAATAVGITGTAVATIGAVAGAVAVGVVTGAVMGAASAAITGGNILTGALKGAVIGGVSAGVMSGLGIATGFASATDQLGSFGLAADGTALQSAAVDAGTNLSAGVQTENLSQGMDSMAGAQSAQANSPGMLAQAATPEATGGMFGNMSDKTVEVISGGVEGAMNGVGQMGAAKMEADSAEELQEWKTQQAAIDKASNQPGEFDAQVANISVPEWWNNYLSPTQKPKTGILTQGAAA